MGSVRDRLLTCVILAATGCSENRSQGESADAPAAVDVVGLPAGDPVAADGHCLEIIVDRYTSIELPAAVTCGLAHAKYFGAPDRAALCAQTCGDPAVNWCDVPDLYWFDYELTVRSDGGESACPDPLSEGPQRVACEVIHTTELGYPPPCGSGRRPDGLVSFARTEDTLGAYFAECAHLEAASVVSFEVLAADLRAHGAPYELAARAESAAADEVVHARIFRALAARFGAAPRAIEVRARRSRDLLTVVLENAAEGLVRETYGAAALLHGARHAADEEIRAALGVVAEDECRHAALSIAVDDWARQRTGAHARAQRASAMQRAVRELRSTMREPSADLVESVGLPSRAVGLRLLRVLEARVWQTQPCSRRTDVT